jgi:hypothetical protein
VAPKPTKDHASQPSEGGVQALRSRTAAIEHAVRVIAYACYLAGSRNLIAKIRSDVCGPKIRTAIARHDTPALFDWLVEALSYQGISDRVAYDYMQRHGCITWADIDQSLSRPVSCPKLRSYWHYYDCSYQKSHGTCGEPNHISRCPVPAHNLRNGRLNQTAYALYLFIRDIADCDLVAWIDGQLGKQPDLTGPDQLALGRDALIAPLRNVHGISDKVIAMALSSILLAAPREKRWRDAGAGMIAIDTLVHNFLHRTGILRRFAADHPYGAAWTIPATRMKADAAHVVPLSEPVRRILADLPRFKSGDFLFSTTFGKKPVAGYSKAKVRLNSLMLEKLRERATNGEATIAPFVLHDCRRTMRTGLSALPIPDLVRELVIAHTKPGLHKVYDQHAYLAEKAEALTLWAARLRDIIEPPLANVVALQAGARA